MLRVSVACRTAGAVDVTAVGVATRRRDASARIEVGTCEAATAVISNVRRTSATPRSVTTTAYRISLA